VLLSSLLNRCVQRLRRRIALEESTDDVKHWYGQTDSNLLLALPSGNVISYSAHPLSYSTTLSELPPSLSPPLFYSFLSFLLLLFSISSPFLLPFSTFLPLHLLFSSFPPPPFLSSSIFLRHHGQAAISVSGEGGGGEAQKEFTTVAAAVNAIKKKKMVMFSLFMFLFFQSSFFIK
jgi:hypothetical protein